MSNDGHVHVPVKPPEAWQSSAVGRWSEGMVCTLPSPRRAVAVPAGPSPACVADPASSPPPALSVAAAHVPSDGGCSQTPHAWHPDRCPASTVCQSGSCPGKTTADQFREVWAVLMLVLQWEREQCNSEGRVSLLWSEAAAPATPCPSLSAHRQLHWH